jgi:hypothetical protein
MASEDGAAVQLPICEWCHEPITGHQWQAFKRSVLPTTIRGVLSATDSLVVVGPSMLFCSTEHVNLWLERERSADDGE